MKKTIIFTIIVATVLSLSQCKKTSVAPTSDEGCYMTLTVGYGNRTAFTPSTGTFVWSDGATEYIYICGWR